MYSLLGYRVCVFALTLTLSLLAHAADQHWIRVSSDRFAVLTDANEKTGHEVVARLEQIRAIFGQLLMRNKLIMGQPMDVIALGSDAEYSQMSPLVNAKATNSSAFWLPGEDRIFIVLNLSQPNSWQAIEQQFAHYLLNYNYPPTPVWFDDGLAEYFASLNLTDTKAEIGGDPTLSEGVPENGTTKPFTQVLKSTEWMSLPDMLSVKKTSAQDNELFRAEAWIFVHYLVNKDKLSEAGAYFNLTENKKVAPEQAIQQAFGVPAPQLDQEVKDYFHSIAQKISTPPPKQSASAASAARAVVEMPLPFSIDDVGTSSKQVPIPEAQALLDEMKLRVPERRQQAVADLQKLIDDPKTETVVAHRALAWGDVQRGDTNHAFEELNDAVKLNPSDPWTRFGLALASYHSGQKGARVQGLANMMESLHIVISEFPNFAQAYNMLGWARLAGGGPNSAVESLKLAVQLDPRNEQYQLLLAEAYFAAKKFNDATAILDRLKLSQDPPIAEAASKDLSDLPFIEKYGVPPEEAAKQTASSASKDSSDGENDDDSEEQQAPAKPAISVPTIDKRAVKFLKGLLLSVDCSKPPAAVLSVSHSGKILNLRASDYKSVAVIGAQNFSCSWKGIAVNLNYRASGAATGDLVSIEVQ
jgi:tetratricopeptide (TPR) repeat protein